MISFIVDFIYRLWVFGVASHFHFNRNVNNLCRRTKRQVALFGFFIVFFVDIVACAVFISLDEAETQAYNIHKCHIVLFSIVVECGNGTEHNTPKNYILIFALIMKIKERLYTLLF